MSHRLEKVFSFWDYIVFISLLLSSSLIGIFFAWQSRNAKNSDHFFTGGRNLAIFPVTMSLIASFMSTNTLLGVPAEVYQVGTQYTMQVISIVIVIVLAAEVYMPVYYRLGVTSVNEYLYKRFKSKHVKLAGSLGFLFATMPYMAVVLYGPAIALSSVINISISASILVVGAICTFYTSIGGIKAVIWTDVLQCILMFIGVTIVIIQGLLEFGGFWEIVRITEQGGRLSFFNFKFDPYNHNNFWNVVIGMTIGWGAAYCAKQTQIQRYMSMNSEATARRSLYYNIPGLILLSLMAIFSGMIIYVKYHDCDPVTLGIIKRHDQLIPYYVIDTLAHFPGVPGLFVASVFSGSLSTLSSGFNAQAAITWEDLLKDRLNLSPKNSVHAVKIIAFGYGLLAIALSYGVGTVGTVLQAGISLNGAFNGPLFAMFTMAILLRFVNAKGVLSGFIGGLLVSLTVSFGAIILPRPKTSLPTGYSNCSADIFAEYLANGKAGYIPPSRFIPVYENPIGPARFVHISYLLVSLVGFTSTTVIAIIVSLLTNGAEEGRHLDSSLFSPISRFFPPYVKEDERKTVGCNKTQIEMKEQS